MLPQQHPAIPEVGRCGPLLVCVRDRSRRVDFMEQKTSKEYLAEIAELLRPVSELSIHLVNQADIQAYTENLYNQLVVLAYEGIAFLDELHEGQVITAEWIARRDELIHRAEKLILDAPNAL